MVPELEKPRVTEIHVRMDCNGCVQKIKKALHGIQGIYEVYPDIAQQKLTVIGWAEPERIVKAIRKTRKTATISSHSESPEAAAQPTELPSEGGSAAPEAANPPSSSSEAPPAEAAPQPQSQPEAASSPAEPPKDQPPPENPQPAPPAAAAATAANASQQPAQPSQLSGPKDVGEVHVICYHHPPDYGRRYGHVHSYGGPWSRQYPNSRGDFHPEPPSRYPNSQAFRHEQPPQPAFVTHSYNTYKPSPCVTEYEHVHSPPRYSHYSRIDHYNEDYHHNYSNGDGSISSSNGNGNITSIFSDENPNACRIM